MSLKFSESNHKTMMTKSYTRYNPKGTKLSQGANSAGRSNGERTGVKMKPAKLNMIEFGRACDRFMVAHVPGYRVKNFMRIEVTVAATGD